MSETETERFTCDDGHGGAVPCVMIRPRTDSAHLDHLCFLFGGGGTEETLVAIRPLLETAWASGALPPCVVATAGVPPFCFYLDDEASGARWESVIHLHLAEALAERARPPRRRALLGISMGGYGALKIAFAHPTAYAAVAAVAPMIEPLAEVVPPRNRFHYPDAVPARLLGDARDAALYERDHPAHRALRNAEAIRRSALAVHLDAGSLDALHAHDGCESLHRTLWALDVRHGYHLERDADHVGPSLPPRLARALAFLGAHLGERATPRPGPSPGEGAPETRALRAHLAEAAARARAIDPGFDRVYGELEPTRGRTLRA